MTIDNEIEYLKWYLIKIFQEKKPTNDLNS